MQQVTTSGGRRDPEQLLAGLVRWCEQHRPDLVEAGIDELVHPSAGMSNETVILRCRPAGDGMPGPQLVVRLPPLLVTFPDFALQARVQAAAGAAGIPVAGPVHLEEDPSWVGVPFIAMPFVEGHIPGIASLFDPWLTEATPEEQRAAQREMVRVLALVHDADWRGVGLDVLLGGAEDGIDHQLDHWDAYLRWASDGEEVPRIEALLAWCRAHQPPAVPPSLVWGDPRLQNLVVDEHRRTRAVLDWELATVGPIEMDLGWYSGLERVLYEMVDMAPLPGFAPFDEVAQDLADAIGRPLQDPAWHEIFAVTRSICINVRQAAVSAQAGESYLLAGGDANPMVAIVEGWIAAHPGVARPGVR